MKPVFRVCWIAIAIVSTAIAPADAQYPVRPVRIIVPTSTGGGSDTVARLIAKPLSERLGQQVVVDNRAGAATMVGTESAANSAPDGYTLLVAPPAFAVNPLLYRKVNYDPVRDFAPITHTINQPSILVVHPAFPAKSVKELIAVAKGRPGDVMFATAGPGSSQHLAAELFLHLSGTRMLQVPYKGPGPGVIDLVGGRVQMMITGTIVVLPHIRSGRLRALGVTTARRTAALPDLPTLAEAGVPGYEAVQWNGWLAPARTPAEVIARLHREVTAILRMQDVSERLAREGADVVASSPEEFAAQSVRKG